MAEKNRHRQLSESDIDDILGMQEPHPEKNSITSSSAKASNETSNSNFLGGQDEGDLDSLIRMGEIKIAKSTSFVVGFKLQDPIPGMSGSSSLAFGSSSMEHAAARRSGSFRQPLSARLSFDLQSHDREEGENNNPAYNLNNHSLASIISLNNVSESEDFNPTQEEANNNLPHANYNNNELANMVAHEMRKMTESNLKESFNDDIPHSNQSDLKFRALLLVPPSLGSDIDDLIAPETDENSLPTMDLKISPATTTPTPKTTGKRGFGFRTRSATISSLPKASSDTRNFRKISLISLRNYAEHGKSFISNANSNPISIQILDGTLDPILHLENPLPNNDIDSMISIGSSEQNQKLLNLGKKYHSVTEVMDHSSTLHIDFDSILGIVERDNCLGGGIAEAKDSYASLEAHNQNNDGSSFVSAASELVLNNNDNNQE